MVLSVRPGGLRPVTGILASRLSSRLRSIGIMFAAWC
jgi:hypothetical protein